MVPGFALLLLSALAAVAAGAFLRERRLRLACARGASDTTDMLAGLMRLQRLAAAELRGVAVSLLGHSQAAAHPSGKFFDGVARQLIGMSDDMMRRGMAPAASHVIEAADVQLMPVLEFGVAQIAAGLGPGCRAWRIGSIAEDTVVFADRRALHQILLAVLSAAAAATREGDWIDVSLQINERDWQLRIEDEGAGLAIGRGHAEGSDNRGMGYGLTLARSLMQAHGGRLEVQSAAQIGTCVTLTFPLQPAPERGALD